MRFIEGKNERACAPMSWAAFASTVPGTKFAPPVLQALCERSKARVALQGSARPARVRLHVVACGSGPTDDVDGGRSPAARVARASTSVVWRGVVEVCALVVGGVLLFMVLGWRAVGWIARALAMGRYAAAFLCTKAVDALRAARSGLGMMLNVRGTQSREAFLQEALSSGAGDGGGGDALLPYQAAPLPSQNVAEDWQGTGNLAVSRSTFLAPVNESAPIRGDPEEFVLGRGQRRLVIMRHARSEFDRSSEASDFDRAVSPRGRAEAGLVGAELHRLGCLPKNAVCSASIRTIETLRLLRASAPVCEDDSTTAIDPTVTESLYFAISADEMVSALDDATSSHFLESSSDSLLCVSHNPGCEALIEYLSGGHRVTMMPATAVILHTTTAADSSDNAEAEVDAPSRDSTNEWSLIAARGRYEVVHVLRPKDLAEDE